MESQHGAEASPALAGPRPAAPQQLGFVQSRRVRRRSVFSSALAIFANGLPAKPAGIANVDRRIPLRFQLDQIGFQVVGQR